LMSDDEPNGAILSPWTVKDMPRDMSAKAVAYARRHQIPVAQVVAEALALRLDQHAPSKPMSVALRSDQQPPSKPTPANGAAADTLATIAAAIGTVRKGSGVPVATRKAINDTALMILDGVRQELAEQATFVLSHDEGAAPTVRPDTTPRRLKVNQGKPGVNQAT
jgi:hypothetical protein